MRLSPREQNDHLSELEGTSTILYSNLLILQVRKLRPREAK